MYVHSLFVWTIVSLMMGYAGVFVHAYTQPFLYFYSAFRTFVCVMVLLYIYTVLSVCHAWKHLSNSNMYMYTYTTLYQPNYNQPQQTNNNNKNKKKTNETTFNNGCLGSGIDEERSKPR